MSKREASDESMEDALRPRGWRYEFQTLVAHSTLRRPEFVGAVCVTKS